MRKKYCPDCDQKKSLSEFYVDSRGGHLYICKKCHIARMLLRRKTRWPQEYEEIKARRRKNGRAKEYRREAQRQKEQYHSDPEFRFKTIIRARLRSALKGTAKLASAIALLGVTPAEALQIIEQQFQPGMTWDNWGNRRGQWSVDHVIPISEFDLSDAMQLVRACHISNLQPLWVEDNLRKWRHF
jgi:5-methylcytosine-specific restriction endonuclease McrA